MTLQTTAIVTTIVVLSGYATRESQRLTVVVNAHTKFEFEKTSANSSLGDEGDAVRSLTKEDEAWTTASEQPGTEFTPTIASCQGNGSGGTGRPIFMWEDSASFDDILMTWQNNEEHDPMPNTLPRLFAEFVAVFNPGSWSINSSNPQTLTDYASGFLSRLETHSQTFHDGVLFLQLFLRALMPDQPHTPTFWKSTTDSNPWRLSFSGKTTDVKVNTPDGWKTAFKLGIPQDSGVCQIGLGVAWVTMMVHRLEQEYVEKTGGAGFLGYMCGTPPDTYPCDQAEFWETLFRRLGTSEKGMLVRANPDADATHVWVVFWIAYGQKVFVLDTTPGKATGTGDVRNGGYAGVQYKCDKGIPCEPLKRLAATTVQDKPVQIFYEATAFLKNMGSNVMVGSRGLQADHASCPIFALANIEYLHRKMMLDDAASILELLHKPDYSGANMQKQLTEETIEHWGGLYKVKATPVHFLWQFYSSSALRLTDTMSVGDLRQQQVNPWSYNKVGIPESDIPKFELHTPHKVSVRGKPSAETFDVTDDVPLKCVPKGMNLKAQFASLAVALRILLTGQLGDDVPRGTDVEDQGTKSELRASASIKL